jgi:hypothetical protein
MLKSRVSQTLPVPARWFYQRSELVTQSVLAIVRRGCESVRPIAAFTLRDSLQVRLERRMATH